MLERLKELLRHSAIYGLGSIVSRVLAVLLLPLYTRYLSPSDYGLIETLIALSAVLTRVTSEPMARSVFAMGPAMISGCSGLSVSGSENGRQTGFGIRVPGFEIRGFCEPRMRSQSARRDAATSR